ncbi:hypothetical protein BGL34_06685 [Fructilactobacillus lindneri]|uniref:Uncharacterized protein n=2 Tax=Fructilactobacillus lindneri TaxID=53444 RepID=A0A0R2JRB2_9LACO|nr:DUF3324 domain-containing protein [Fructilactobacillus lindneri]KRN79680.1 hypothetical protein IV52_GL000217 [Fructilactobacillus lindneri DSM 20690 = JCM 11027]POH04576.1 hypothetical protein BGL33_06925 [Fructilactobacillus lindneri]POH04646.1 hypothetical protein BGL34_06685 [Fructilactobacillus lindneri]POH08504.1 hypothetical protein BGL36_06890 [Fructilactobacillus lindneri]POH24421.1 hypothetical protein BHU33_07175 [Fructilactobacillus lindneri DSM 20690 = JCM 11027]
MSIFLFGIFGLTNVNAAENSNPNLTPIGVTPDLNVDGQVKDKGYYDFNVGNEGINKKLKVTLVNPNRNKNVNVIIKTNPATTGNNVTAVYSKTPHHFDNSMKLSMGNMLQLENDSDNSVTLKPNEQKNIYFNLKTPNNKQFKEFKGTILGGIYILEYTKDNPNQQISNRYAYAIGVRVNKGKHVYPDLKLNKVHASTTNLQNQVIANIQNFKPSILGSVDVNSKVTKKNSKSIVASKTTKNGQISPNSSFNYAIPWKTGRVTPGRYTLTTKVVSHDPQFNKPKTWYLKKDFSISVGEAAKLNTKVTHSIPWFLISTLLLLLILIIFIITTLVMRKRKNK